jgi:hypothetical protein
MLDNNRHSIHFVGNVRDRDGLGDHHMNVMIGKVRWEGRDADASLQMLPINKAVWSNQFSCSTLIASTASSMVVGDSLVISESYFQHFIGGPMSTVSDWRVTPWQRVSQSLE